MFYSTALFASAFQQSSWWFGSLIMSRLKAQVTAKEVPKNLADKTRSSSVSHRETAALKVKRKPTEDLRGPENSTEEKPTPKRKPTQSSSVVSKEPVGQAALQRKDQQRPVDRGREGQARPKATFSKPATVNHSIQDNKVPPNAVNRNRHKEQPKSVVSNRLSQGVSKPKTKNSEALKADHQKIVVSEQAARRERSSVTTPANKSLKPDNSKKKAEETLNRSVPKTDENGSGDRSRLNRERTKTRTINPEDSQLMTALQNAAQQLPQDIEPQASAEAENEYEDDFEDYESDFEEAPSLDVSSEGETTEEISKEVDEEDDDKENYDYGDSSSSLSDLQINKEVHTSSNGKTGVEEKKMDSGHYDLSEDRKLTGKASSATDTSKNMFGKETVPVRDPSLMTGGTSNTDNGLEIKVINFAQAKKRQQERKASSKLKHRGEILLNMIRLDSVSFPLYEMAPIPYEVYMRSYGRSNTQQVFCQTNEDGMTEEVQTDEIVSINKWTQHPPALIHPDDAVAHPLICAVSSDPCDPKDLIAWRKGLKFDILQLERFILNSGQLMLNVLEETSSGMQGLLKSNKADLGFSQGFITLGTESVPFLKNRKVSKICFVPYQPNSLISIHLSSQEVDYNDDLATQMVKRCVICIWSLLQPSQPLKYLVSSSDVTSCTFHPSRPHLLFGGLMDGLLNVWDLKEEISCQSQVLYQGVEWTLKSPTYTTVDHLGVKHMSAIVGVQVIDSTKDAPGNHSQLSPTQICTLDETGLCILWTLLSGAGASGAAEDAGVAPGGSLRLLQNTAFPLAQRAAPAAALDEALGSNLQFADLSLDGADPAHLLAAANTGHVLHALCSGSGGGRAHPAAFLPDSECPAAASCICPCPFGLPYFLLGCADGTVRLHSRLSARPLLCVAATGAAGGGIGGGPAVVSLQWAPSRPCVFFALDAESRLHVWDLGASDMYPLLTVPFRGRTITAMQLSPSRHAAKSCPYLALGTACGRMKVHVVKDTFASTSLEDTALEMDKFRRYVSIL